MRRSTIAAGLLLVFALNLGGFCQQSNSKWQVGTIMAVAHHHNDRNDSVARQYDVSVKVGNTLYVVLYVSQNGSNAIMHRAGIDLLVSVGTKSIAFNDLLGKKMEAPILSQRLLTPAT